MGCYLHAVLSCKLSATTSSVWRYRPSTSCAEIDPWPPGRSHVRCSQCANTQGGVKQSPLHMQLCLQIFEYNGSAIVAMAGKECFAIGSDLRFGVQFQTLATDHKKVYKVPTSLFVACLIWRLAQRGRAQTPHVRLTSVVAAATMFDTAGFFSKCRFMTNYSWG